jgi:hypothetical protein
VAQTKCNAILYRRALRSASATSYTSTFLDTCVARFSVMIFEAIKWALSEPSLPAA